MAPATVAPHPSPPPLPTSLSDGETPEENGCPAAVPATVSAAEQEELNIYVPHDPFDTLPLPVPSLKRAHSPPISSPTLPYMPAAFKDEWPSDDESHETAPPAAKKARTIFGVVGISASAVASKEVKLSMADGSLEIDPVNLERYKEKCRAVDGLAEFRQGEKWQVFHSVCAKWYTMKEAYQAFRFKEHVATCSTRLKQLAPAKRKDRDGRTGRKKSAALMRTSTLDHWAPQLGWVKQEKPCAAEVADTTEAAKGGQVTEANLNLGTAEVTAEAVAKPEAAVVIVAATVQPAVEKKISSSAAAKSKTQTTSLPLPCKSAPCPGITASHEPRVTAYLDRTGALGGGAPSVTTVARDLFGNKAIVYSKLSGTDKEKVDTEQKHRWAWRNDHGFQAVFSATCRKSTSPDTGGPCLACSQVLRLKSFRNALKVPMPKKDDYRYLNEKYRNASLGTVYTKAHGISGLIQDKVRSFILLFPSIANIMIVQSNPRSTFVRFAEMVQDGKFDGDDCAAFLELVKAMVDVEDRNERGVGMQNFKYGPALLEFAHTCAIVSPTLYRSLQSQFKLPAPRTLGLVLCTNASQCLSLLIHPEADSAPNSLHFLPTSATGRSRLLRSISSTSGSREALWR